MVPGTYNITIYQRATFERQITVPIDLTGHHVYAQVWDSLKRRRKFADFEINVIDQANGVFIMSLDWQDSTLLKRPAFWDLMIEYANGTRDYWLEGTVTIDPGLTAPEDAN